MRQFAEALAALLLPRPAEPIPVRIRRDDRRGDRRL
jgi:hypothetical protein